jgi:hypothetical protein
MSVSYIPNGIGGIGVLEETRRIRRVVMGVNTGPEDPLADRRGELGRNAGRQPQHASSTATPRH